MNPPCEYPMVEMFGECVTASTYVLTQDLAIGLVILILLITGLHLLDRGTR